MRVASVKINGRATYGVIDNDQIRVASAATLAVHADLRSAIAAVGIAELPSLLTESHPLQATTWLPVIPNPDKIFCIGINYATHIAETGRPLPEKPVVFMRYANSQVAAGQPIIRPLDSVQLDYEGELAVVIGRAGRRIAAADAFDYVAGYACYNDGSVRDFQRHSSQFGPGKNFPATGGFGPWMVTTDEIPDPSLLHLETRLNGQVMQAAPIADLVFDVPALVAYCSTFTELVPGDVIVTGTTGGVGLFREPPLFMKDGDVVEVQISGIGTLVNPVRDER